MRDNPRCQTPSGWPDKQMAASASRGQCGSVSIDHYENFPVASWLCPPSLRPAVAAIYWFARTADDLADEGDAPAPQRLADLAAYRLDLDAVMAGPGASAPSAKGLPPPAHAGGPILLSLP